MRAGPSAASLDAAKGGRAGERRLGTVALIVRDYDEAIDYFERCLGFETLTDTPLEGGKRWVTMAPPGGGACLLLAKAVGEEQRSAIGRQSGGRVFLFLETGDFDRDHARFVSAGVHFEEAPRIETYGKVAVFTDLYGNRWDLIEPL